MDKLEQVKLIQLLVYIHIKIVIKIYLIFYQVNNVVYYQDHYKQLCHIS